jgi:hypothetical protein
LQFSKLSSDFIASFSFGLHVPLSFLLKILNVKTIFFLLISYSVLSPIHAQKFGMGLQFFGPTVIGSAYFDYELNKNLRLELGGGLVGAYGGLKLYTNTLNSKQNFRIYSGAHFSGFSLPDLFGSGGWNTMYGIHIPFGIQWRNTSGFSFAAELGPLVAWNSNYIANNSSYKTAAPALRFGYYFKSR